MPTRIAQVDDAALAERMTDALQTAGIEVFARSTQDAAGIIGQPGVEHVIEVADGDEARARALVAELMVPPESAAEPAEAPAEIRASSVGAYKLASNVTLAGSSTLLVLAVLSGTAHLGLFVGALFDFLLWRRFHGPVGTASSLSKARIIAMVRLSVGVAFSLVAVGSVGGGRAGIGLAAQLLALVLYLPRL